MTSFGLPNLITLTRFAAIPPISYFFFTGRYDLSLALLGYAGFSDLLDGGLARFLGMRTKLGAILDPAADKSLMLVCFMTLAFSEKIPLWIALMVIVRDVYIVIGVFILKFKCKKVYIRPTYVSKMTTFFQLSLIFFIFLQSYLPSSSFEKIRNLSSTVDGAVKVSFYMAVLFTIASGIHYTLVGWAILRGKLHEVEEG